MQSASTRDVGTEMTPIASHEPSRTTTPLGSMTPVRSPKSSTPSTPERGASANAENFRGKNSKNEMSERELRLKTRKEIAALGIQLGKMNIASWASKEELESSSQIAETIDSDHLTREFEARAEAWEEAENSKHTARYFDRKPSGSKFCTMIDHGVFTEEFFIHVYFDAEVNLKWLLDEDYASAPCIKSRYNFRRSTHN